MVAFHQRYHHREPITAKTPLLGDDLLACVLGGVYTDVEKTMIEIQKATMVQETRNAFQNTMQDKFINTVERLSGRQVMAFFSTITSVPTSRSNSSSSHHRNPARWDRSGRRRQQAYGLNRLDTAASRQPS